MARFDVYRLHSGDGLVLDCQADLLSHLQTRFVVPLMTPDQGPERAVLLNPLFDVEGLAVAMYTQYAGTMPKSELGSMITSLRDHNMEIQTALDILMAGY
jgi:toxin CcdB